MPMKETTNCGTPPSPILSFHRTRNLRTIATVFSLPHQYGRIAKRYHPAKSKTALQSRLAFAEGAVLNRALVFVTEETQESWRAFLLRLTIGSVLLP